MYDLPNLTYIWLGVETVQLERVRGLLHLHHNSSVCLQSISLFLYYGFICVPPH